MTATETPADLSRKLTEPFAVQDVHFKPQVVKGNRALAIAYIDARAVMDRLDEVVGLANWQDNYTVLADNSVMCRLKVRIGRAWITKVDVGSPSEQPDGGDRMKARGERCLEACGREVWYRQVSLQPADGMVRL